jgi:hypothetical protein
MKVFAATFSFYILFLSVLPTFVSLSGAEKKHGQNTCCNISKHCEKKSDNNKDNGSSKGQCTPFFGCTKIQAVFPIIASLPIKDLSKNIQYAIFTESYISTSHTSVWHPPKVV